MGIEVRQRGAVGVEVARFRTDSLADESGLRVGDVIVAMNGQPTPTIADVSGYLLRSAPGQRVTTRVVRGSVALDVQIPLVARPTVAAKAPLPKPSAPEAIATPAPVGRAPSVALDGKDRAAPIPADANVKKPEFGVPVDSARGQLSSSELGFEVSDSAEYRGVVVESVAPGSPAASADLAVGDRIVSLDGALLANSKDLAGELASRGGDAPLELRLVRDGVLVSSELRLGEAAEEVAGTESGASKPGSAINGIGAMIGGLFGGKPNAGVGSDGKPKVAPAGAPESTPAQPVRPAGFDAELTADPLDPFALEAPQRIVPQRSREPAAESESQPAAEELELPPGKVEPMPEPVRATAGKTDPPVSAADRLREEIRQLEQRLKELETKQAQTAANSKGEDAADASSKGSDASDGAE